VLAVGDEGLRAVEDVRDRPSISAFIFMAWRSEPAPGSVMAMAPTASPVTIFGSQRSFCAVEPRCMMYGATMSLCTETFDASAPNPRRDISSTTIADSRKTDPAPPYSSGTSTHRKPFSPRDVQSERGKMPSFSQRS
jgi:hypothetical protein